MTHVTDADRFVVVRAAVRAHKPAEQLTDELDASAIEALVPTARNAYERRQATAARLRRQLGIDTTSPAHDAAVAAARELVELANHRGSDTAA